MCVHMYKIQEEVIGKFQLNDAGQIYSDATRRMAQVPATSTDTDPRSQAYHLCSQPCPQWRGVS
jgi:hypothetical protein